MKKVLVVICVLIASYGYAQDAKFGIKAGWNFANISGSDVRNAEIIGRGHYGLFFKTQLSTYCSFQTEVLYSEQGFQYGRGNESEELKTSYINFPLLWRVSLDPSNAVNLYAGPQFGFLLDSEKKTEVGDTRTTEDVKDEMNSFDFGLNFGICVNVSQHIAIDLRYNKGLRKMMKFQGTNISVYNSVMQLGASYSF